MHGVKIIGISAFCPWFLVQVPHPQSNKDSFQLMSIFILLQSRTSLTIMSVQEATHMCSLGQLEKNEGLDGYTVDVTGTG